MTAGKCEEVDHGKGGLGCAMGDEGTEAILVETEIHPFYRLLRADIDFQEPKHFLKDAPIHSTANGQQQGRGLEKEE